MQNEINNLKEYQKALIDATLQIYERVYKFNITKGVVDDDMTKKLLKEDGFFVSENYDDVLKFASKKIIEKSFIEEFLYNFSRKRIEELYKRGERLFTFEYLRDFGEYCVWYKDITSIFMVGDEIKIMILVENIDKTKKQERKILENSKKDSFTGLLNKIYTKEAVDVALKGSNQKHGFFVIDIDYFKTINDINGHLVGDNVIKMVSAKIKNSFRDIDIIGRVGGDEFLALLKDVKSEEALKLKATEIKLRVKTLEIKELNYEITLSIGATLCDNKDTYETAFSRADEAMYEVKRGGKDGYIII